MSKKYKCEKCGEEFELEHVFPLVQQICDDCWKKENGIETKNEEAKMSLKDMALGIKKVLYESTEPKIDTTEVKDILDSGEELEYLGSKGSDEYYSMRTVYGTSGVVEDIEIVDSANEKVTSAKELGVDVSDMVGFIKAAIAKLEITMIDFGIVDKYILQPKKEKEEEEKQREEMNKIEEPIRKSAEKPIEKPTEEQTEESKKIINKNKDKAKRMIKDIAAVETKKKEERIKMEEAKKLNEMSRDRIYKVTTYPFDELKPEAKKKAIEELYYINVEDVLWYEDEALLNIAATNAAGLPKDKDLFTWDLKNIQFNIEGYSEPKYIQFPDIKISDTEELFRILKIPASIQKDLDVSFYNPRRGRSTEININREDDSFPSESEKKYIEQAEAIWNEIMKEAIRILERHYIYLTSEEVIIDTIKANEYEFTEDGKVFRGVKQGKEVDESKVVDYSFGGMIGSIKNSIIEKEKKKGKEENTSELKDTELEATIRRDHELKDIEVNKKEINKRKK